MAKTRNISVYLLKDSIDLVEDALRDDSGFTKVQDYTDDNNGILYFKQNDSNICWWSTYFDIDTLYNKSHSAAYFLKYNNRIFVFCFGQGRYAIKEELLVDDFAHKSALNVTCPPKIVPCKT